MKLQTEALILKKLSKKLEYEESIFLFKIKIIVLTYKMVSVNTLSCLQKVLSKFNSFYISLF